MSIIRINAITVPDDSGDELAHRFAARAGAVDDQDGFEGFELLKPTDERTTWLVVTRWRDQEAFEAWVSSPAFAHGHRSEGRPAPGGDADGGGAERPPVAVHSELWSYEVVLGS
jgi:heme oxygenase (mycobilin-producing)